MGPGFHIYEDAGPRNEYLTYTENASPAADQWAIEGIYVDAEASVSEVLSPGILDPGEEMVIMDESDILAKID